jgi:hypothetical protein
MMAEPVIANDGPMNKRKRSIMAWWNNLKNDP